MAEPVWGVAVVAFGEAALCDKSAIARSSLNISAVRVLRSSVSRLSSQAECACSVSLMCFRLLLAALSILRAMVARRCTSRMCGLIQPVPGRRVDVSFGAPREPRIPWSKEVPRTKKPLLQDLKGDRGWGLEQVGPARDWKSRLQTARHGKLASGGGVRVASVVGSFNGATVGGPIVESIQRP
ncbi:hypothetical protein FN846DRAFT_237359 [Sphaerosporella brunnea]|uniref:Uncharacterized protein n=1 Tax=Sphaerosporella brunnea TaxID=1250544 RepID=A0A5J5FCC5_9PEZI|nr:hypothetical protein FN846DRAFT_237359 [Sphaerosporella brunnea]